MLKTYLKIALRGFAKHRLTFFINLSGLSLGLWAANLIGLWVDSELNVSREFADVDRIYRIKEQQRHGAGIFTTGSTQGVWAENINENPSEIEYASTYIWIQKQLFIQEDRRIKLSGIYAMPDLLQILQYDVVEGDRNRMLTENNHLVLIEKAATSLFGRTDVLGEGVEIPKGTDLENYIIQGVQRDLPASSSLQFDYILPYGVFKYQV
ncbi:ABC transporter permease [Algoriphagus sp. Y33]|uniref:ABC transporter permease n=1 Tax=Algoriphagus sp. Y33 TaxID=2772483 RepID=UPI0017837E44|nr:ABC transporter permease [Algoriphagus sp. Y33]